MIQDAVATRYAQAVFETANAQGAIDETLQQMHLIGGLINDHAELRQFIRNPGIDVSDKVQVLDRLLRQSWSVLVRAFVQMVVGMGRADSLPDIAEALRELVDAEQGRLRVVVRSAYPLPETVLAHLRTRLEHRERKQIALETEVAPQIVGGLQIVLGHRVIDGSVRRHLSDLREQLKAVRVY